MIYLFYAASIGISILAFRIKEERFSLLLIAGGLFLIPTILADIHFTKPEWNPHTTNAELAGVWVDSNSRITLNSDGSASFDLTEDYASRIGLSDSTGGWHKQSSFTVQLLPFHMDEQRQIEAIKREGNAVRLTTVDSLNSSTCPLRIIRLDDKLHQFQLWAIL